MPVSDGQIEGRIAVAIRFVRSVGPIYQDGSCSLRISFPRRSVNIVMAACNQESNGGCSPGNQRGCGSNALQSAMPSWHEVSSASVILIAHGLPILVVHLSSS